MSDVKDGGPAFPYTGDHAPNEPGMTLRDYFAAAAINAQRIVLDPDKPDYWRATIELEAKACYAIADAMLKERDKP